MAASKGDLSDGEKLLFENIQKLNVGEVIRLLNEEGTRADCLDANGMSPLQHAAYRGNRELCEVLLDRGADVNSNHHEHGYTALMFASLAGNHDVISDLLTAGASTTAVNSVKRNAAQMAAFVGNHACVTLINNFVPKESIEYYTKIRGLETEPRLPLPLVAPLHRLLLQRNIHPVAITNFLRENAAVLEQAARIGKVLELMCEREMKRAEVNEVLALKFHFFSFVVKQCAAQVDSLVIKKSDKTKPDLLDDVIKHWLRPRQADGFQETLEKMVRQSIREFPYPQSPLLQQLVRNLAPVKLGDEPTALGLLTSSICGQRFGSGEEEHLCAACGNHGAERRCSVCKAARYCEQRCQRLHWPAHKRECPRMAEEYEEERRRAEEEAAKVNVPGESPREKEGKVVDDGQQEQESIGETQTKQPPEE